MLTINNTTDNNHLNGIKTSFLNSDKVIIVSPFLWDDLSFFPFEEMIHLSKITLVTRLKPFTADQYQKIEFMLKLFEFGEVHGVIIEVLIDNFLHGKVYVSIKAGSYREAIITSANFNRHGLIINNQWGVVIKDIIEIDKMVTEIRKHTFLDPLILDTVKKMKAVADQHPKKKREKEAGLDLSKFLKVSQNPLHINRKTTYWLKPIGVSDNPIPWAEPFDKAEYPLHFAKDPKGVKPGHIVIAYAVGHGHILSIFEVVSTTQKLPGESHRWAYYVMGKNLTPHYGERWYKHQFYLSKERVLALNLAEFNITPSGLNTFGTINFGGDKMRLTKEFCEYVIQKIMSINKEISEAPDL
ncbi:hypothetical protein SAMN06265348_10629 [Pedobacter westerhofensis]|uniref:Restriction endonuclease type II NgoFVII N-terminal domain-containing protein n=1 Tax=Pedobacter westerhofensis TaxID=425512 RepID=A0A521DNM3_9SPHI|nr:restriction endonuclease PLD domain-containing protein [Pedobacter westerhofensis]SMO73202.1 hypothetical protein SAMN06265348_10629 [Pedobacter westerhofensis]